MLFRCLGSLIGCCGLVVLGCGSPTPRFDNVVLITIDTLRVDHLGAYGYPRATSPFIDSLAADGVLFRNAFSASSHTAPAHTSMLTSLSPARHGVLKNGVALSDNVETLAGVLSQHSFESAAFTSVSFLQGIGGDFDHLDAQARTGGETVEAALSFLRQRRSEKRLFLWVHLYDVHRHTKSGRVPKRFRDRVLETPAPPLRRPGSERNAFQRRDLDRYDGRVAYVDSEIQTLYEAMQSCCVEGSALWIITSDHGEGLGDHDHMGHGRYLYNEQVHVPLVLHAPDGQLPVSEVDALARHIDLMPTVLELVSLPAFEADQSMEGRSLVPHLDSAEGAMPVEIAFSQRRPTDEMRAELGWEEGLVITAQSLEAKYIYNEGRDDEFYDLETDPHELENLMEENRPEAERLKRWLMQSYAEMQKNSPGEPSEIQPEFVDELRALGYIQ